MCRLECCRSERWLACCRVARCNARCHARVPDLTFGWVRARAGQGVREQAAEEHGGGGVVSSYLSCVPAFVPVCRHPTREATWTAQGVLGKRMCVVGFAVRSSAVRCGGLTGSV
eukprot:3445928-Rhodomonas_salina.1